MSIHKQRGARAASHVHVPSFHISSAGLDVMLATDERLLSKVHLEMFEVHLSPGPPVEAPSSLHGAPTGMHAHTQQSHAISCTARVFSIHDLSLAGAMHPDVVTKATPEPGVTPSSQSDSPSVPPPMLAVTYTVPHSRTQASTIRIHLHGVQVCFLFRFLQELIQFIGPNMIQAVMEKIQQGAIALTHTLTLKHTLQQTL